MTNFEAALFDYDIPALKSAWQTYHDIALPFLITENSQRFGELRRRIDQVEWILSRVQALRQNIFFDGLTTVKHLANGQSVSNPDRSIEELILHCETFYWVANRLREVPVAKMARLPGFKDAIVCEEIRLLRNRLIEHNEGASEEFSLLGANGPVLRGLGDRGIADPGLFVNASKFCQAVVKELGIATNRLTSSTA